MKAIRFNRSRVIAVTIGIIIVMCVFWSYSNSKWKLSDNQRFRSSDIEMMIERGSKKNQIDKLMNKYDTVDHSLEKLHPNDNNKMDIFKDIDETDKEDREEALRRKQYALNKYLKSASIERGTKMSVAKILSADGKIDDNDDEIIDQSYHHMSWKGHHLGFNKSTYAITTLESVEEHFMPEIGNGHLATVAFSNMIYMNNFYSGQLNASHRAAIPAFITRNLTSVQDLSTLQDGINLLLGHRLTLDVAEGVFTQTLLGQDFIVEQRYYAHRNFTPLIVHEIDIQRKDSTIMKTEDSISTKGKDLRFFLPRERRPIVSEDLNFSELDHPEENIYGSKIMHMEGDHSSNENKNDFTKRNIHIFYTKIPEFIDLPANITRKKFTFILSADKKEEVARQHILLALMLLPNDYLYLSHLDAWRIMWESGHLSLSATGNLPVIALTAQYYLYSSLPWRPHAGYKSGGVSPLGLARGGFNVKKGFRGHVYWDQDFWIFPAVLTFHPGVARSLIDYRVDKLKRARLIALSQNYQGAQFPWESGRSGVELTWDPDNMKYQHHVTGDVALAVQTYMLATNDTNFYYRKGGETILRDIAQFWSSRSTKRVIQYSSNDSRTQYEIHNAMGPDENHFPVNNSAYTNAIAKLSLLAPSLVWNFTHPSEGSSVNSTWLRQAAKMYIPYDKDKDYTPEFDHFDNAQSKRIKQADVTLLRYPINEIKDLDTFTKNLLIYEKLTADGPCMTWGIHAIGWLELQEYSKATDAFRRQLMHAKPPFHVWTEYSSGGRTNFLTGIGGFVQSLVNGYLGMRITTRGLILHPALSSDITGINATDFDYLGNQLSVSVRQSKFTLTLIGHHRGAPCLRVTSLSTSRKLGLSEQPLLPNQPVYLQLSRYLLQRCVNEEVWPDMLVPAAVNVGRRLYDEDVANHVRGSMLRARRETETRLKHNSKIRRSDAEVAEIVDQKKSLKIQLEDTMHIEKHIGKEK